MVKIDQEIIGEQCIRTGDSVVDNNIAWKNYHEQILNTEIKDNMSEKNPFSHVHILIYKIMVESMNTMNKKWKGCGIIKLLSELHKNQRVKQES